MGTPTPVVSILVPCHNAAPWLAETLNSALVQAGPVEVIVVDDGSTDDSLAIARRFQATGVRVLAQPNTGASAARNAAFRASRGEWIQYLDADDLLAPDKLAIQLTRAGTLGREFCYTAEWGRFRERPEAADFIPQPLCRDDDPVPWLTTKMETGAMMHPAAWLIHRSIVERAGPWDESLSLDDDGEFFTRAILASRGVRHCRGARTYYRSGLAGSLSGRRSPRAWDSALRSQMACAEGLLRAQSSPATRKACAALFQRLAYQSYPDAPEVSLAAEARASTFGVRPPHPEGGRWFRLAATVLGWRLARRLQSRRINPR